VVPLSVLDLAPIVEGADARQALLASRDLARHAERLGYRRFWLAEHHNFAGIASAATAVAIGHVAAGTSTIRVGAGGVMLPNHAPLVVAEQFGTLDALFPGRIDLGLGRAPGTDPLTAHALRRYRVGDVDGFPEDVDELLAFLHPARPGQPVVAVPGAGADVEVWMLGSSLFGAQLAAKVGLPYAFASHFAPAQLARAAQVYRNLFKPSPRAARSRLMLGVNVVVADTDAEARRLRTSGEQAFVALRRGKPIKLPPPVDHLELRPEERAMLDDVLAASFVGSPDTVRRELAAFVERHGPDELIVASQIFDHAARLRSYELLAGLWS
jgi:luciferase family oxidoreductase group 1